MANAVIQSLYRDYFQKSTVFLYPALGIKRGVSVTPIQNFTMWKDHYHLSDCKLISLYELRNDQDFIQFEKTRLRGNRLFHDFRQVDDNKGVYVFDLSHLADDFGHVMNGRYSKISPEHKKRIKEYIGFNNPNLPYIESFLHPEKYFKLYAEMMEVPVKILREVGELCDPPNREKEKLDISILNLELQQKSS